MTEGKFTVSFTKNEAGADVTVLRGVPYFSAAQTFDCGQCFRFNEVNGGIEGTAFGRFIRIEEGGGEVRLIGVGESDYRGIFERYLGLSEDYGAIRDDIGKRMGAYGDVIFNAMECASGIRILYQDAWEAVASFIISQNNNIPRIKKIIENMSLGLGEAFVGFDGKTHYAFPTAEAVLAAGEAGLAPFKMGFRARYLIDAAKKHLSGEVDFEKIETLGAEEAQKALMSICGVGPKVASCALLFGFHKLEFFPVDVWIKRVLAKYYPGGIDISALGAYAGVAQQYLFYYERYMGGEE